MFSIVIIRSFDVTGKFVLVFSFSKWLHLSQYVIFSIKLIYRDTRTNKMFIIPVVSILRSAAYQANTLSPERFHCKSLVRGPHSSGNHYDFDKDKVG